MKASEALQGIVFPAVEKANRTIPNFRVPAPTGNTALFGLENAALDSFSLVSFVFLLEKEVCERTGFPLRITSEDVLHASRNPFASLLSLAEFLAEKIPPDAN